MSKTSTQSKDSTQLTDEERSLFEDLADEWEGETIGRMCRVVAQSSKEDTSS